MKTRTYLLITYILAFLFLVSCAPHPSETPDDDVSPSGELVSETPEPTPTPTSTPEPTPEPTPTPRPTPENLVPYNGTLYHVFYHFLIAYPDIAYADSYGQNLDTDCVTPTEFRRSLEELYKNNFVLMDLNDYYVKNEDGSISMQTIMVPEGKKPLIMSFDDINYYEKKLGLGICDKVIIDPATDKLAMLTIKDGQESITYDNDVIPMLETFCEQYPDFAPFGVKGMLCLTGYNGILGYRTQAESPTRQSEIEAVAPIVQKLKDNGWYFASHGYGHRQEGQISVETLKKDADDWETEVAPLVGGTKIHVFPFGNYAGDGMYEGGFTDPRMRYLIDDKGFEVLCGVGMGPFFKIVGNSLFTDRANIDGYSLRAQSKHYADLMDPNYVYCQEERNGRPITWTP